MSISCTHFGGKYAYLKMAKRVEFEKILNKWTKTKFTQVRFLQRDPHRHTVLDYLTQNNEKMSGMLLFDVKPANSKGLATEVWVIEFPSTPRCLKRAFFSFLS